MAEIGPKKTPEERLLEIVDAALAKITPEERDKAIAHIMSIPVRKAQEPEHNAAMESQDDE